MSALTQALVDAGFNVRRAEAIEAAILGATLDSANVAYDNATSGLSATDVQAAIDELQVVGTWEPTLTFATPGDLAVVYSSRLGQYAKVGQHVVASFEVIASSFTHSTAAGNILVSGLPFANAGIPVTGASRWSGVTKVGYTDLAAVVAAAASVVQFQAYASASAVSNVVAADVPSGGTPGFRATLSYQAA